MTLTHLKADPFSIEDELWAEVEARPLSDDWLGTMWGVRPGASSPRRTPGPVHPSCTAAGDWLRAMWGFSA